MDKISGGKSNGLSLEQQIKLIVKSVEFTDTPFFTAPFSKTNLCLADRNKNDFSKPHEITYSSTTWFPDYIFFRITFVKRLEIKPIIISRKLILKERESFDIYQTCHMKSKVLN